MLPRFALVAAAISCVSLVQTLQAEPPQQVKPARATAEASADAARENAVPRLSFQGFEVGQHKGVKIMGSFFRTRAGDFINFIPVQPKAGGVWTRTLNPEVKQLALAKIEPQQHVPVIAFCDIETISQKPPVRRPGVTTGAYFGPIHTATVSKVVFLTADQASETAQKLIDDETLRTRFLGRFRQ